MINRVSQTTKENIHRKSTLTSPDNPSAVGETPLQIKKRIAGPVLDPTNSALSEIDRVVDEANSEIQLIDNAANEHKEDTNIHITAAERIQWNEAQSNIIEEIKVNGTAKTPIEKTIDITAQDLGAGKPSGLAQLDANQKLLPSQLPDGINTYEYYDTFANFPTTGQSSVTYVDRATNNVYLWTGSDYTNITASLALGETESTAFRGDWGKTAYEHSQLADGTNPHNTTFENILDKPTTLEGYGITDALKSGQESKLVSDIFQSRITATNDVEIIDSQLDLKTAEIISIKAPIGGVTNVTKLTSVGDNLVNVADHDMVTSNQYFIDHNYGLVLLPNTQYKISYDYDIISTDAVELKVTIGYGELHFDYDIASALYPNLTFGNITVTFITPATFGVPSPVLFVREARRSSPHTSKVRISNIMVQFAVSPNTSYIPHKTDYVDIPDKILRSNADGTSDEITPTQHIQRVDENKDKLSEAIYTPIVWDNKYSAWNNGMEILDDTARVVIEYPTGIVKQVETNTEILAEQEKQIAHLSIYEETLITETQPLTNGQTIPYSQLAVYDLIRCEMYADVSGEFLPGAVISDSKTFSPNLLYRHTRPEWEFATAEEYNAGSPKISAGEFSVKSLFLAHIKTNYPASEQQPTAVAIGSEPTDDPPTPPYDTYYAKIGEISSFGKVVLENASLERTSESLCTFTAPTAVTGKTWKLKIYGIRR